jgi:hypothetical protein
MPASHYRRNAVLGSVLQRMLHRQYSRAWLTWRSSIIHANYRRESVASMQLVIQSSRSIALRALLLRLSTAQRASVERCWRQWHKHLHTARAGIEVAAAVRSASAATATATQQLHTANTTVQLQAVKSLTALLRTREVLAVTRAWRLWTAAVARHRTATAAAAATAAAGSQQALQHQSAVRVLASLLRQRALRSLSRAFNTWRSAGEVSVLLATAAATAAAAEQQRRDSHDADTAAAAVAQAQQAQAARAKQLLKRVMTRWSDACLGKAWSAWTAHTAVMRLAAAAAQERELNQQQLVIRDSRAKAAAAKQLAGVCARSVARRCTKAVSAWKAAVAAAQQQEAGQQQVQHFTVKQSHRTERLVRLQSGKQHQRLLLRVFSVWREAARSARSLHTLRSIALQRLQLLLVSRQKLAKAQALRQWLTAVHPPAAPQHVRAQLQLARVLARLHRRHQAQALISLRLACAAARVAQAESAHQCALLRAVLVRWQRAQLHTAWTAWRTAVAVMRSSESSSSSSRAAQSAVGATLLAQAWRRQQLREVRQCLQYWRSVTASTAESSRTLSRMVSLLSAQSRLCLSQALRRWQRGAAAVAAAAHARHTAVARLQRSAEARLLSTAWSAWVHCARASAAAAAVAVRRAAASRLLVQALDSAAMRMQRRGFRTWVEDTREQADRELKALEGQYYLAQTLYRVTQRSAVRHTGKAWVCWLRAAAAAQAADSSLELGARRAASLCAGARLAASLLACARRCAVRRVWSVWSGAVLRDREVARCEAQRVWKRNAAVKIAGTMFAASQQKTARWSFAQWSSAVQRQIR